MKLWNFHTKKQKRHHKRNTLLRPDHLCWRIHRLKNSFASTGLTDGAGLSGSWNKDRRLGPLPSLFSNRLRLTPQPGCTGGPELHIPFGGTLSFKLIHREGSIQLGMLKPKDSGSWNHQLPSLLEWIILTYLTAVLWNDSKMIKLKLLRPINFLLRKENCICLCPV